MYVDSHLQRLCNLLTEQPLNEVLSSDDWAILADLASRHDLGAFFFRVITQRDICCLDNDRFRMLKMLSLRATAQFMLLEHTQLTITELFNHVSIPHTWLKGIALAATVYPDGSFRPMNDLDVLVPYELRLEALKQLQNHGFELYNDDSDFMDSNHQAAVDRWHHFKLRGGAGNNLFLELHFRYLGREENIRLSDLQAGWLSTQAWSYDHRGYTLTTLKPEAHLLYLCAHLSLQHGIASFVLKWYLDLHLLITRHNLDWKTVVAKAAEFQWTYAVERILEITVELFSTQIPASLFQELRNHRSPLEDMNRVDHLAGEAVGFEMVRLAYIKMPWKDRLPFILKTLVPPPRYVRQRYQIPPGKPVRLYYLYRWHDQLRQIVRVIQRRMKISQPSSSNLVGDNTPYG